MEQSDIFEEVKLAMQNHELRAYYQPQYDALTKKLVSAEALVRWVLPNGKIRSPAEFVPQLEASGKILELDWYMLEEVCQFLKERISSQTHCVPIAVNFSRHHIVEEGYLERLCAVIDKYEVPRNLIEIEVIESALVEHSEKIKDWISAIRAEGMRVAIDDFGSGLSSLSFVKDVAFDVLKIDRSLISHNCEDEKERIVLESIFNFAHRLKIATVTEGVETSPQLEFLRTCSCEMIQGFLFAKPMPKADFIAALANPQSDVSTEIEDILKVQPPSSATQLLLDAVFTKYPLVIIANLTRNSAYFMTAKNFTSTACPSSGPFDELIAHGAETMHPEDRELFKTTFSIEHQMKAYALGRKFVQAVTRQKGDDGIYRKVETSNYFVKNPSSTDVLVITLCQNVD